MSGLGTLRTPNGCSPQAIRVQTRRDRRGVKPGAQILNDQIPQAHGGEFAGSTLQEKPCQRSIRPCKVLFVVPLNPQQS
ncbi:hypothetical protein Psi02_28540 [Planotetraspora silvatica]|uniref:Uncharacterized protein n=1 Tax=Planotetraspora silvatica TaxID=234614 RepID=A0A8J3XMN9_9ACTN|nr:hypothetical protein Psi02_28540 [Planotetraspora silvatica]